MGKAKEIEVKAITSHLACDFVREHHYSHKTAPNSQLHFGVYLGKRLHGVLQFGPSIDKKKTIALVKGTQWNGFLELNRMVFDYHLPRNSESRAIGICLRLIRKHAPHVKWVISFADATQCGTGTIYRASGFLLTQIKENRNLKRNPKTGEVVAAIKAHHLGIYDKFKDWEALEGYQIRYVYFLDPSYRAKLTVDPIPYSELDKLKYPKGVRHRAPIA